MLASKKELNAYVEYTSRLTGKLVRRKCDHPFYLPKTSEQSVFYIDVQPETKEEVPYVDISRICLYEFKKDRSPLITTVFHNQRRLLIVTQEMNESFPQEMGIEIVARIRVYRWAIIRSALVESQRFPVSKFNLQVF